MLTSITVQVVILVVIILNYLFLKMDYDRNKMELRKYDCN